LLVYSINYSGPTKSKGKKVYFKFGIYRGCLQRCLNWNKDESEISVQIFYFDEVRKEKSKEEEVAGDLPTLR
jgi:hypothetical protein|tara:strand:- start:122 stop:337 length:216 start_codon:yes stop_codon:yes gene_type:complete